MNSKLAYLLPVAVIIVFVLAGSLKKETKQDNTNTMIQDNSSIPTTLNVTDDKAKFATITTSKGDIKVELFESVAPGTVANFKSKVSSNYYKGLTFHRVEDWVLQGGDPLGTGTGGGNIATELSKTPFELGSLGVARGGNIEISNDSQFFICTADCAWLTGQYTNFGKVVAGLDVAKKMQVGDKILGIKLEE